MGRSTESFGPGTLNAELRKTAEMLVDIVENQGVYFAVALLYDSSYDLDRIRKLLPVLEAQKGAVKTSEGRVCVEQV